MLFQIHISLLQAELSSSCSPSASGVSSQAAQLSLRCSLHSMPSASPSMGHFCQARCSFCIFFQGLHSEQLQTMQWPGVESCRERVGKPKEACWKGDHSSLGWLYKRLCIFWCFLFSNNKMVICTLCFLRNAASFLSHKNGLFPLSEQIRGRELQ